MLMSRFLMRMAMLALPFAAAVWPGAGGAEGAVVSPGAPAMAASVPAPVGPVVAPAVEPPQATGRWYSFSEGRHLGFQLDAGAPEGAGLSVLFRPWWWVRFNGGVAYNYIGVGMRGGVSFVPWHWAVTPSLNLDVGHYFSGDASKFVSNPTPAEQALYKQAAYDFASAQLGLEFGSQRGFSFYLRGGLVYLAASASGASVTALASDRIGDWSMTLGEGKLRAVLPCASLGFIFYVY